jgi:hypothetical protein
VRSTSVLDIVGYRNGQSIAILMAPTSVSLRFRNCLILRNRICATHRSHRVNVPDRSIGIVQGDDLYVPDR